MNTKKNVSNAASALALMAKAGQQMVKGKGLLVAALVPMVKGGNVYSAKSGDIPFTFRLADYSRPVFYEGELVKAQQGAKFTAFCEAEGIAKVEHLQSDFVKCLDSAIAIALGDSGASISTSGKITLPLRMARNINLGTAEAPSAIAKKIGKNKLEGTKLQKALDSETVIADGSAFWAGGKAPTPTQAMHALQQVAQAEGLIPTKAKRTSRSVTDTDKTRQALQTVNTSLIAITRSDESPIALTDKDEAVMREIAQNIAAYFAS